jgi:hypothetical protein
VAAPDDHRRLDDHRLHHPTLAERDVELGDDQRRGANHDSLADFDGYVRLWCAPPNGGSPITDYIVQVFNPDLGVWETYPDGVSTTTRAILEVSGFGCDDLRVAARNAAGVGPSIQIRSCFLE